ncbi:uncharacterized protein LOC144061849 [Vanacampus margaritifer]
MNTPSTHSLSHTHSLSRTHTLRSAELYLAVTPNHRGAGCLYKAEIQTPPVRHLATSLHHNYKRINKGMKHRRLLQSLPLLPTIMETLEDSPLHLAACQSTQTSQSLDDYMSSIQALARPDGATGSGPFRLQRPPRLRQLSKAQMKHSVSASLPRGSPLAHRTCRSSCVGASGTEDCFLRRQQDSRGKDPVDWLFAQMRT